MRIIARLNVGGPAIHTTLLTERLDPRRYLTRLVTGVEEPSEGSFLELHGKERLPIDRIPALRREINPLRDLVCVAALAQRMRAFRPHIVHTHTAKAGTVGRLAALLTRVPVLVHTFHGHVFEGYFSPAKVRAFLAIERWLAARTHRLLTVSPSVRSELLQLGIGHSDSVQVLPLGLDLEPFTGPTPPGRLRTELGLAHDTPTVGIVARLVPVKAHEVFLCAVATLRRTMPDVHAVVVGDGERRRELERMAAELGIAHHTHFLGWRSDLAPIYADLELVALTSKNEGSPVALIEAMAAGRAVVTTRVGGVPDIVRDDENGCLVARDDAEALARTMARLLGDADARGRLGLAARRTVVPRFGAARLLADVDSLYTELGGLTCKSPSARVWSRSFSRSRSPHYVSR